MRRGIGTDHNDKKIFKELSFLCRFEIGKSFRKVLLQSNKSDNALKKDLDKLEKDFRLKALRLFAINY